MSAPFIVQHQFADIDELGVVARRWEVDFRQLDPGPFRGSVAQLITPSVQLAGATFSRRVDQRGAPPRRLRSVAMAARPDVRFFWRGHHVTSDDLLIFPLGGEIECVSAPGFANLVLSVEEELLEVAAERMGQAGVSRTLRVGRSWPCRPRSWDGCAETWHSCSSPGCVDPTPASRVFEPRLLARS